MDESDGVEEAFEGMLRVMVTAAGRAGEHLARAREQMLRQAQARSEQEAAELRSRIEAERAAARSALAVVHRPQWWDRAGAEQIGRAYQSARAWADVDPEAARAEQRIVAETQARHGVDVRSTGGEPVTTAVAMDRAAGDRAAAAREHRAAREDVTDAVSLLAAADRADHRAEEAADAEQPGGTVSDATPGTVTAGTGRAAPQTPAPTAPTPVGAGREEAGARVAYDSTERREAMAADLEAQGIEVETVATRVRADASQAQPATGATTSRPRTAPGARKTRKGRGAQVHRTGRDR
jgi:hypothetical protein